MAASASHNPLINIATRYKTFIDNKYKGIYNITHSILESGIHKYDIDTVDNNKVGYIGISSTIDNPMFAPISRRKKNHEHVKNNLHIYYLDIESAYQRKGLGTELLLYGICDLYVKDPVYNWITLDDDTNEGINKLSTKHIYVKLGFMPRNETVELVTNSRMKLHGKNALSETRYTTIDHLIGAIVPRQLKKYNANNQKIYKYRRNLTRKKRRTTSTLTRRRNK
jgi:ribosomal protein S18 acetylase RimI-like enzyme